MQDNQGIISPECWTAIIPAAGRGSRLGFDQPKILFPVAGRPILDWLLEFLLPVSSRVVLVLSPDGRGPVEKALKDTWKTAWQQGRFQIAVQPAPTGMGDAVAIGLENVETENTAIVWGDQAGLRPESVRACFAAHQTSADAAVTFLTVWREQFYIHFGRDEAGRITSLLQAREGDTMPAKGESDTGFFCFRTVTLKSLLSDLRHSPDLAGGKGTGEFNFLPAILLAAKRGLTILTPQVVSMEETMGVNSREDALQLEKYLRSTACHP